MTDSSNRYLHHSHHLNHPPDVPLQKFLHHFDLTNHHFEWENHHFECENQHCEWENHHFKWTNHYIESENHNFAWENHNCEWENHNFEWEESLCSIGKIIILNGKNHHFECDYVHLCSPTERYHQSAINPIKI